MNIQRGDLQELNLTDDEDFLELVELELFPRAPRNFRLRDNHFLKWNDEEFRARFRLSKDTVQLIIEEIRDSISCIRYEVNTVTIEDKVLITLRFLATGSTLQAVGDFTGIDKSTASRIIYKVITTIARLCPQFVKMPESEEEVKKVQEEFYNISRFPRCIGALDCTHVKIQSPGGDNAETFRNRKGFFSFNVQALCKVDLTIQNIVCRWPGSVHDATIFDNSQLRARLENGDFSNALVVGDSGYAVKSYLMTPLSNPQLPVEHLYNESQIRTRNPIERCFGVIKRRFPVLALGIRLDVHKVEAIVIACAVLHNIACDRNEPELSVEEEVAAVIEEANSINLVLPNIPRFNMNNLVRHNIITQYFQALL